MRVAPIGAYFSDDIAVVVTNAPFSCELTQPHSEGITGAIVVALGTAIAGCRRSQVVPREQFITEVLDFVPVNNVREGLESAKKSELNSVQDAARLLGNGSQVTAQDTVPFVLSCAGERLTNYEEAIWLTASAGGDVDTMCAMVGGIVAMYSGIKGIPPEWLERREPLPEWVLGQVE
jgi:ADP-ribosylglycohydrolase